MADAVQIRRGYNYGGPLPPDWTWINFIVDEATAAAVGSVVTAVGVWGREWIRKARKRDPDALPIRATIYGPTGEVLREVEVRPEED
ncbi:MAG: hypothetical protein H0V10_12675 [Geodermatophilaceae bacterium]|nr:hypothetical protein [Geodermatophilaceae bacterium]